MYTNEERKMNVDVRETEEDLQEAKRKEDDRRRKITEAREQETAGTSRGSNDEMPTGMGGVLTFSPTEDGQDSEEEVAMMVASEPRTGGDDDTEPATNLPKGSQTLAEIPTRTQRRAPRAICYSLKGEEARAPRRGTDGSVGYDLFALKDVVLEPQDGYICVPTGVRIATPPGIVAFVAPRSGNSLFQGVQIGAGIIDPDYRGEIMVVMRTIKLTQQMLPKEKAIAQLLFIPVELPELVQQLELEDYVPEQQGAWVREGGFASTDGWKPDKLSGAVDEDRRKTWRTVTPNSRASTHRLLVRQSPCGANRMTRTKTSSQTMPSRPEWKTRAIV